MARIRERMRLALKTGEIGVWEYDMERQILHWGAGMFEIYSIPPDHFEGEELAPPNPDAIPSA